MQNPAKWGWFGLCIFLVLQSPDLVLANEQAGKNSGETMEVSELEENEALNDSGQKKADPMLERHKSYLESKVQKASLWVDGFFGEINYEEEAVNSQFRLRPEISYQDEQAVKLRLKVLAKIRLPNLGSKVSLVVGSDESDNQANQFDDDSDQKNSIAGLQFFLSESEKWNASLVAGVKFSAFALILGPRFRYQTAFNDRASFRFTQTVRWQSNNHWDIGSRGDLNYVLGDRFYFRQTVNSRWRGEDSDEEGLRTRISSVLSQKLSSTAGLQYDFSAILYTEPDTHFDQYTLSLRYRKRTHRDWLYYEIVPQVAFEDEFDFKANPGIRFRLEFFYGGKNSNQFWKNESEDTEEFRW